MPNRNYRFLNELSLQNRGDFPTCWFKLLVFLGRLETLYKPFLIQCQERNKPHPNLPQHRPQATEKENYIPSYFH